MSKKRKRPIADVNNRDVKGSNPKYRLNDDELELINNYRRIYNEAVDNGLDPATVKSGWIKNENSSLYFKNPNFQNELTNQKDFQDKIIESLKEHAPTYPLIKREKQKDGHLLIIDIADLHINKYAELFLTGNEYNSKIAVERALDGTKGILQKSSGFHIDKIVFVVGNDVLNIDNANRTTTKGTPQDCDLHWYSSFILAKECYVKCIEMCLGVADVDVIHCPSNHDYITGTLLAETLSAHFRNCKNIEFNTTPKYRKYYQYYDNMIEFEHGDKGKLINLPLTMAHEEPKMWADTKFRYGYLHHVHHSNVNKFNSEKDYIGVNLVYLRSPSNPDLWHYENQFLNMVAVEGFIHSKEFGRVSHITHYF